MALGLSLTRRLAPAIVAVACAFAACLTVPADAQAPKRQNDPAGRVHVEGLPSAFNDDLVRLLRQEPSPDSLFEANRQAARAAETVGKLLESEGYYRAVVTPKGDNDNGFHRRVDVTLGPLFIFAGRAIALDEGRLDEVTQRDLEALLAPLATGAPARAQVTLDVEDAILRKLRSSGYPDARANTIDALADGEADTMEITYHIVPGPRTSFGGINITGVVLTRPDYLRKLAPWSEDEGFSETKLDQFRARLAETGLFSTTGAALAPEGSPGVAPYDRQRDVDVTLVERERQTIALGASASTSEGYGVNGEWDFRNWSGRGDTVMLLGQIASLQSFIEASYRRPNISHYGRNLRYSARIEKFETDAYDQMGGKLGVTLEEQLTPRLRGSVGLEGGYASIADAQAVAQNRARRDVYFADLPVGVEYTGVRDISTLR